MPTSLTSKIAILFAVSLSLISSVILFIFSLQVYNSNKNLFIQSGHVAAQELEHKTEQLLQLGLLPKEFFGYEALCQKLVDDTEGIVYAALVNGQGNTIFQSSTPLSEQSEKTKLADIDEYKITQLLPNTIRDEYAIVIIVDQMFLETKLTNFITKMVIYAGSIILLGLIIVIVFLRSNLGKPIESLITHIKHIELNDHNNENWDLLIRKDELGIVAKTFNAMMLRLLNSQNSLEKSNQKLQKLTNELESRVESRTKALNEANKKLYSMARVDTLTGFSNRRKLEELLTSRFENAQRHGHNFSILMADLDKFKLLNDNYGHAAGDYALKTIGARILGVMRGRDSVYRIGGDEFVFIIEGHTDISSLISVANKIKHAVEEPIFYHTNRLSLGISIGIAVKNQDINVDANALLSYADQAMYQAKKQGLDYVISGKNNTTESHSGE